MPTKINDTRVLSWTVSTFVAACGEQSATMMEPEVWLSSGEKIHDVEKIIDFDEVTVVIHTMTHSVYVREQDVIAIKTV